MSSKQYVSPTIEEYLENIFRLENEYGVARTKQLAKMIGVSLGTVTNTITSLKRKKFVTHKPYKGVKLTDLGQKIAINVLRRHRLSERLLTDLLNIDWSKAHNYACRLEHAITDDLTEPLEKALGHPKTCPHGNPIPTLCGGILEEASQPLDTLSQGKKSVVTKVVKEKQDLLEYLMAINLVPGTKIEITEKAPFDGPITIKINGKKQPLSKKIASIIWVKKES